MSVSVVDNDCKRRYTRLMDIIDYQTFGWAIGYVFIGIIVGTCSFVWVRERGSTDDEQAIAAIVGGIFWFIPVVIAMAYPLALKVEAVYLSMSTKAEERRNGR